MVANFRTEDAQRRLLTAVIAAHPDLRLNFKAISQHFGDDWGIAGIEHFFRPLKKDAVLLRDAVQAGQTAKEFFDNKAEKEKGATAGTAGSSAPVTPKTGRKRAAPSAPSTAKSTTSKKARPKAAKPVQAVPVITVDDDEDENEFPPISLATPIQGPRFTETYAKQFYGADAQTPAPDMTQAETPNEEEDFKPQTPSDAAAFSFCQAPSSSGLGVGGYNLDAFPISQPFFAPSSGFPKAWPGADDYDDEV